MRMFVSNPLILGNVLYAKGFLLRRRRASDNPATYSLPNLTALEPQSRPSFSILNRAEVAHLSRPLGCVHVWRASNIRRQQPRNIARWRSVNLGKHEIQVVMYRYCIPTARQSLRCCLTIIAMKNAKYLNIRSTIFRHHSRAYKNAPSNKHFENPSTSTHYSEK
jgi:hypothetical protein